MLHYIFSSHFRHPAKSPPQLPQPPAIQDGNRTVKSPPRPLLPPVIQETSDAFNYSFASPPPELKPMTPQQHSSPPAVNPLEPKDSDDSGSSNKEKDNGF